MSYQDTKSYLDGLCNLSYIQFLLHLGDTNSSTFHMQLDKMYGLYLVQLTDNTIDCIEQILADPQAKCDIDTCYALLRVATRSPGTVIMGYNLPTGLYAFDDTSLFHIVLGVNYNNTVEITIPREQLLKYNITVRTHGRISDLTYKSINTIFKYGNSCKLPKYVNIKSGKVEDLPTMLDANVISSARALYRDLSPCDTMFVDKILRFKNRQDKGSRTDKEKTLTLSLISELRGDLINTISQSEQSTFHRENPLLQYSAYNDVIAMHYIGTNIEECYVSTKQFCRVLGILSPFEMYNNFIEYEPQYEGNFYYGEFDSYYEDILYDASIAPYSCRFLIAKLCYTLKLSIYVKQIFNIHFSQNDTLTAIDNLGLDTSLVPNGDVSGIRYNLPNMTCDGFKDSPFQPCAICVDTNTNVNDVADEVYNIMNDSRPFSYNYHYSVISSKSYDLMFGLRQNLEDYGFEIGYVFYKYEE